MKKGLILEGGAMRGMFTAGVIDVMMEQGIVFDGAIGVSAGAAFGCNYKSRQIGRVIRYNIRFCQDKRYGGFRVLLKTGDYYSRQFCYEEVPLYHDVFDFDAFESNPMEFHVVCTDVCESCTLIDSEEHLMRVDGAFFCIESVKLLSAALQPSYGSLVGILDVLIGCGIFNALVKCHSDGRTEV